MKKNDTLQQLKLSFLEGPHSLYVRIPTTYRQAETGRMSLYESGRADAQSGWYSRPKRTYPIRFQEAQRDVTLHCND